MKPSNEAFWWSLFSAGGVMSALFLPAFIVVTGLVLPFMAGDDPGAVFSKLGGTIWIWVFRIVVFGIVFLTFFHCAHRIRHVLIDLGLRNLGPALSVGCYAGALAGSIVAAVLLLRI